MDDYFEIRGAKHVLSDTQVLAIRREYKAPGRLPDGTWEPGNVSALARKYGVHKKTICNAANGYTYSWVRPGKVDNRVGYLTDDQIRYIRNNYKPNAKGTRYVDTICERFSIHRNTVYRILRGQTYKEVV